MSTVIRKTAQGMNQLSTQCSLENLFIFLLMLVTAFVTEISPFDQKQSMVSWSHSVFFLRMPCGEMLRNAEHNVWPTLHKMSFWLTAFVLDCIWKVRLALSHYCLWILAYKGWNLSDVERMALTCNVWYLRNLSRFSTGGPNSSKSVEEWFQLLQTVLSP